MEEADNILDSEALRYMLDGKQDWIVPQDALEIGKYCAP